MIEDYFQRADVLIRLQSGPVGPYLPGFLSALEQRRFSHDTIHRYVRGADTLCRWLDGQGIALVEANQKHIEAYVCHCARLPDNRYIGVVSPNRRKFRQAITDNISGSSRIESTI